MAVVTKKTGFTLTIEKNHSSDPYEYGLTLKTKGKRPLLLWFDSRSAIFNLQEALGSLLTFYRQEHLKESEHLDYTQLTLWEDIN